MMLINGAVPTAAARVCEVSTDRSLEEALAAFTCHLAIVLTGTLVAAHSTLGARRYRKTARDVSTRRRALYMLTVVVAAVSGNGYLLDEVLRAEHRRH